MCRGLRQKKTTIKPKHELKSIDHTAMWLTKPGAAIIKLMQSVGGGDEVCFGMLLKTIAYRTVEIGMPNKQEDFSHTYR